MKKFETPEIEVVFMLTESIADVGMSGNPGDNSGEDF